MGGEPGTGRRESALQSTLSWYVELVEMHGWKSTYVLLSSAGLGWAFHHALLWEVSPVPPLIIQRNRRERP